MNKEALRSVRVATLAAALLLPSFSAAYADTLASKLELMEAQSPIDIRSDSTYYGNLPKLNFNLSSDTALTVINNGSPDHESTIRANVSPGEGTLMLSGHQWNLAQFHFHTPTEQKWPEVVGETGQNGRCVEENHGHAMHREKLVVLLRRQKRHIRPGKLDAQEQRFDSADHEEKKGRNEVPHPDRFVIHCGEPSAPTRRRLPDLLQTRFDGRSLGNTPHFRDPFEGNFAMLGDVDSGHTLVQCRKIGGQC